MQQTFFDASYGWKVLPQIAAGLWLNVRLMVVCEIGILILAMIVALVRSLRGPVFFPLRAAATGLCVNLREGILSLARAPQVPGRLELVPARRQFQIFVDYAHTDDALRNVLKTLRELKPRKLIVVFGCGGDRDRKKRPLMARVADELADHAIITSDNPRRENPDAIINEVEKGFRSTHYEKIADRTEAIRRAAAMAEPRDLVLIAGKGHEKYQEFADHTIPFDDIQVARRALDDLPVKF